MKKTKKLFKIIESPWMPMSLEENVQQNPDKYINRNNLYIKGVVVTVFLILSSRLPMNKWVCVVD